MSTTYWGAAINRGLRIMDFNEYMLETRRTAPSDLSDADEIRYYALGLTNEANEAIQHIRKEMVKKNGLDIALIEEELGDTFWFFSRLADSLGLNLKEIAEKNIAKLKERHKEVFNPHYKEENK